MLDDAATWLADQLDAHVAVTVTYSRDSDSVELKATIGQTGFELQNEFGVAYTETARDYLITASLLILDGDTVEPAEGDLIVETVGGESRTFEVRAPDGGPAWRWSDPEAKQYRVHTQEVPGS